MLARLKRFLLALQTYSERPWYVPLTGALVFSSLFIPIIPSDVLVVTAVMLRPRRWLFTAVFIALCSAIAATVLAYLVSLYGGPIISKIAGPEFFLNPKWLEAKRGIEKYGSPSLILFSFSPLPQQAAIIAAGIAKLELVKVFFAIWVGRSLKYSIYAFFVVLSPGALTRVRGFFPSRPQSKVNPQQQS